MYIIFTTLIIVAILLFWSTLTSMIRQYTTYANSNTGFKLGSTWFVGLCLINILIICFLYFFTYYKQNEIGKPGNTGDIGRSGIAGDACVITEPNSQYYEPYNQM